MQSSSVRPPTHAGSWYTQVPQTLSQQLSDWLSTAQKTQNSAKAIISPHAGYSYSGPTAAWSYRHFDPNAARRVFLLGPSHHVSILGCALPFARVYNTPLGEIPVDQNAVQSLNSTGAFQQLTAEAENDEHSLEMQLPYIRQVYAGKDISLVPIMVGQLTTQQEEAYARVLSPFFDDPETVFVISSDFCVLITQHWGARFGYAPHDKSKGEIWQSIEAMDLAGMALIEQGDPVYMLHSAFRRYLKDTGNTICGRNPISLLLNVRRKQILRVSSLRVETKFVKYDQSEHVKNQRDSSVSYAAAVVSLSPS